jgi:hypothetical protein
MSTPWREVDRVRARGDDPAPVGSEGVEEAQAEIGIKVENGEDS